MVELPRVVEEDSENVRIEIPKDKGGGVETANCIAVYMDRETAKTVAEQLDSSLKSEGE